MLRADLRGVQHRGGPGGLQVDITFYGSWQRPLRDGQQRGRKEEAKSRREEREPSPF